MKVNRQSCILLKRGLIIDIKTYWEVTKPKIWYLLVFTAFMAALIAYQVHDISISALTLILVITSVMAGSAAANTLTNYIDRDIDALMERTKARPIPSGRIPPKNALYFGLTLAGISLTLAYFINILALGLMIFGLFDNIIVYSKWLKRKSIWNIVLGGFSGGAPALIGYVAVTTTTIWSLALHVQKDYSRANIPMLPVVKGESTSIRVIAGTTIMMVVFSIIPFFFNIFGWIYLGIASVLGVIIIAMSITLLVRPTEKRSWTLFKFSSPYLALLFIAMYVDTLLF